MPHDDRIGAIERSHKIPPELEWTRWTDPCRQW